jgi:hypothetical protein
MTHLFFFHTENKIGSKSPVPINRFLSFFYYSHICISGCALLARSNRHPAGASQGEGQDAKRTLCVPDPGKRTLRVPLRCPPEAYITM